MNSLQKLRLRRLIAEIAADTIAAYGITGALSPIGDKPGTSAGGAGGGSSSTPSQDNLDELEEEDLLSFTKADRDLDNHGKKRLWRR
jgi:hypothetical protein